jgi:hypothetical protein
LSILTKPSDYCFRHPHKIDVGRAGASLDHPDNNTYMPDYGGNTYGKQRTLSWQQVEARWGANKNDKGIARCGFGLVLDRWCQCAQPLADVATDPELFAAYCLGVIIAAQADPINDVEEYLGRDAAERQKEYLSQKKSRFIGYLTARGLLSGSRNISATRGAVLANQRGRADTPRCSAKVKECVDKYASKRPYVQKDINDCRDEEDACRVSARCFNDDRLPF